MTAQINFPITKITAQHLAPGDLWGRNYPTETITEKIERRLSVFRPISLAEMADVSLLSRTDTKYVMSLEGLVKALSHLTTRYRVLDIAGRRLHLYQTLYFDSPDFIAYHHHHNGRRNRYKVRSRQYLDSHLAYLEVKIKTNKNRTVKKRLQTPDMATQIGSKDGQFVGRHYPYDVQALEPALWNNFQRITLVGNHNKERLTLDINLQFGDHQAVGGLPGIAIAEVKQEGFSMNSDFIYQMRAQGIRPSSFSKYCIGNAIIHAGLKRNRFKTQLLMVDKLMKGGTNHVHAH